MVAVGSVYRAREDRLRLLQLLSLFTVVGSVLVGCAQPSGDEKVQENTGIFPKATAQEEACMDLWNSPDNFEQKERAKAMLGAYTEQSYASFSESSDFPGECEVVIAVPEIGQARLVRTGGTEEFEGFVYGPEEILAGNVDQVVSEPLRWNAFIDNTGSAIESDSDQTRRFALNPTPGRCVALWNQSGGPAKSVLGSLALFGEGEAVAQRDIQFPDQCLVSASFPQESTVYLFRSAGALAESSWVPAGEVPIDEILPEYTNWMSSVNEDGDLEPFSASVAAEADLGVFSSMEFDETTSDPSEYPKYFAEGFGCGSIGMAPNSGYALTRIQAEGVSCVDVIQELLDWKRDAAQSSGGEQSEAPEGWSCDYSVKELNGMDAGFSECEREEQRLSFVSSG